MGGWFREEIFLHGRLIVHVIEARNLPDKDSAFFNISRGDLTDPFVTCDLGVARLLKTKYVNDCLNPKWDEKFEVYVCHRATTLDIKLKDKDTLGDELVGLATINAEDLATGETKEDWFDLKNADGEDITNDDKQRAQIKISVQYISLEALDEENHELDDSYFPVRESCRMIMYQDADTPQLPQFEGVTNPDESQYEPTRAWRDTYECIKNAQKFIYIAGWSVSTAIQLLRGDDAPDDSNVGELLKAKADDGVKVLMLVWNEMMSNGNIGNMGTNDEDTRRFFEGTAVDCVLVARGRSEGILADKLVGAAYTHHQKTIICDAEFEEDERQLVAFIGGLDITGGRYDTPEFHLFKTLKTDHEGDYLSKCFPGMENTRHIGPRQPWHDIHAKVEGPIALDIKQNFEERWLKLYPSYDFTQDKFAVDAAPQAVIPEHEGGFWNMQLFRSITSDSCQFDSQRQSKLNKKDSRWVEESIQNCMIRQIRNAQRYIYLENQYFLGSAYAWKADCDTLSHHLIPREITQRIIKKIEMGEPFKCYIVIPMYPEGDPHELPSQEILFWQFRTMQTMYQKIAQAIQDNEAGTHPMDYLSFYCLAKQESRDDLPDDLDDPEPESTAWKLRQTLRHPIYVHCKMSIFDDEYILIGSANVNQRSLGGNRDTEIAVGGYQPGKTIAEMDNPRGDIHSFRMALWAAHLGGFDEAYLQPESDDCLAKVKETTQDFWTLYTSRDEPEHSDVKLLPYPIKVDEETGDVTAALEFFPDTRAPVLGAKTPLPPNKNKITT